ncbi:MAG TPA: translocation protein TolB [Verrucomicrobiae bacterium]|nr:translocation protein TolB [Verrucomicrobiae bacterium]
MARKNAILFAALISVAMWFLFAATPVSAQDWFKTGTGLGITKARVAVPETAARSSFTQPLPKTFHDVLWADLDYSGILDLVSPSFYPLQTPGQPSELNAQEWAAAPTNAYMVAYSNMTIDNIGVAFAGYLSDVHNPSAPPAIQKIYRGQATDADARRLAHQFADDIIAFLSGGQPGIAQTKIAYVSARGGNKDIWVMDYDGANQQAVTHLKSIALTPRWSPDATRIAFTCFVPGPRNVVSAQICMYSAVSNRLIAFPRFRGTTEAPGWSPDGSQIAFMSSQSGDPQIYISDADGSRARRITFTAGVSTSPAWNPKTGKQMVFVSDRGGSPVLYLSNSDGSNVEKLDLPDMGYVVDPAWSPNGQLLAFSWRRPSGNYDIYVMDIVSRQLAELTKDAGRNERPSWAPDGRHIVFESTRTGPRQIWSMLADGSHPRQLTFEGDNESPNWSPK